MAKPLGSFKTGGRSKGTPNRRSGELQDALDFHNLDVVAELKNLLPVLPAEKRADVLVALLAYLFPKRKSLEIATEVKSPEPQVVVYLPVNGHESPNTKISKF